MGISLKVTLLRMGLSTMLLGALLFSYVALGCFSPIVVVEDQSVVVRDTGDEFVDKGTLAVNGTDDDSEGSADYSDEEAEEDDAQDLFMISEGNQSGDEAQYASNEDELNSEYDIEASEDIGEQ